MNITGAIFDMDGTLVDSLGFWDYIWERLGEIFLGDKTFRPDTITEKGVRTATLYDAMVLVHNNCGIGQSGDEVFKIVNDELFNYYKNTVQMKDGAMDFIKHLYENGVKICIASATDSNLIDVLMEKFELRRYVSRVISCKDIGKGKEHPDVFIEAHKFLGTQKETTWIFEDSVVAIETATNAGYNTVGIYDKFNFGLDRVKEISTIYIGENQTLSSLIEKRN